MRVPEVLGRDEADSKDRPMEALCETEDFISTPFDLWGMGTLNTALVGKFQDCSALKAQRVSPGWTIIYYHYSGYLFRSTSRINEDLKLVCLCQAELLHHFLHVLALLIPERKISTHIPTLATATP